MFEIADREQPENELKGAIKRLDIAKVKDEAYSKF